MEHLFWVGDVSKNISKLNLELLFNPPSGGFLFYNLLIIVISPFITNNFKTVGLYTNLVFVQKTLTFNRLNNVKCFKCYLLLNQTPTYTISNMWLSRPQVINHSKEETQ